MLTGGGGTDQALWNVSSSQLLSESVSIANARNVEPSSISAYLPNSPHQMNGRMAAEGQCTTETYVNRVALETSPPTAPHAAQPKLAAMLVRQLAAHPTHILSTKMHVGQALLVLQDPAYRPGSVRNTLQQHRLTTPRTPRPPDLARAGGALGSRAGARSGQLLRVAGRVQSRSARATALQAQPPLRHLPRYPIPVPVHDAVASGDWASTSKWLRDREATIALGHPPLLTTPGDIHVQHPHLVGNDLRGDHYDPGTICPDGNTALHVVWGARGAVELPPPDVYHHLLRACPAAVAHRNKLGELPLHIACRREEPPHTPLAPFMNYFELLLQGPRGARGLDVKDLRGRLPLHVLMQRTDEEQFLDTLADAMHGQLGAAMSLQLTSAKSSDSAFAHAAWVSAARQNELRDPLALEAGAVPAPAATVTMAVLHLILSLAPAGVAATDAQQQLPLHIALKSRQPLQVLRAVLNAHPAAATHPDEDGDIPLHIVLKQKPFRKDVFTMVLGCDGRAVQIKDAEGDCALHIAASRGLPVEAVKAIHAAFPAAIELPNRKTGSLPLHLAVSSSALPEVYLREVVEFLIEAYPQAASVADKFGGKLPLHHAVQSRAPRTIVLKVFTANEDACRARDARRFFPYQYCDFEKVEKLQQIADKVAVRSASSDAEALKAFKKIDKNGSGDLDMAEIEQLSRYFGRPLSPKELDEAFEEMDTDRSGTVDFGEFIVWWRNQNKTGRSSSQSQPSAASTARSGPVQMREQVDDAWHEEMFALLSAMVLGERLLLCGRPPREMLALYERALHIYTCCYIELFGSYRRPAQLFARLTTARALCEVHDKLADLMFPVEVRAAFNPNEQNWQQAVSQKVSRYGRRATGDDEEDSSLARPAKTVGARALEKLRRQVYRRRDVLDFKIADGVVERNLIGIIENCDRAFELCENGFDQPIPQNKLRQIQQDALVALSDWMEPAAADYGHRVVHKRRDLQHVLATEGGLDSCGAKQWDPCRQKAVIALIEEAERCLVASDPVQAEALFRQAQERDGKQTRHYPWDKAVDKRLTVGLAKASRLAKAHTQAQAEEQGAEMQEEALSLVALAPNADKAMA